MSTLETNSIGKYSGNNVSIDDALNLKSYDTSGRNALTSVAGDMIYNTTTSKVEFYNGSAWVEAGGASFDVEYLIVAGGGAGGGGRVNWTIGGGGGAGGLRNSYASENTGGGLSGETPLPCTTGADYVVSVGGGGTGVSHSAGNSGTNSYFAHITAIGGGGGGVYTSHAKVFGGSGGSSGTYYNTNSHNDRGKGVPGQGFDRGNGIVYAAGTTNLAGGGGGGAAAVGGNASNGTGGNGGAGLQSSITGTATYYAGGGGGGGYTTAGTGGSGGGADGSTNSEGEADAGTVNTGGGGGGSTTANNAGQRAGGGGGSGIVILRYPSDYSITIGTGLTSGTETTDGSSKYITITGGTGTVSWS
jgi:hypothetical protein